MSLEDWNQVKCKCGTVLTRDAIEVICSDCEMKYKIIPFEKITNPEDIMKCAENELEDGNAHSINACEGWNSIKKFIPANKKTDAARSLAEYFMSLL